VSETQRPAVGAAALARRLAAAVYDGLLLGALLMLATALALLASGGHRLTTVAAGPAALLYPPLLVLVTYGYFGIAWTRSGETLGQKAWGLRLLGPGGRALGWGRVALRLLVAFPIWLVFVVVALGVMARVLPAWSLAPGAALLVGAHLPLLYGREALHDRLSGTRVLRIGPTPAAR
jgi:uncharacterized RDD family membrane protein YckC